MTETIVVGMGEMRVVERSSGVSVVLKMIVGSCVGLFLADRRNEVCGAAHIMIPSNLTDDETAGKYADTAFPALLRRMTSRDGSGVEAYVVGGACMFRAAEPSFISDVGEKNVQAVLEIAQDLGIRIAFRDTGGDRGRSVLFRCTEARISVKTLSQLSTTGSRHDAR